MTGLTDLGVAAIRDGVRDGAFSAREVAEAFNSAVEKGRALNAYTVETPEDALAYLAQAEAVLPPPLTPATFRIGASALVAAVTERRLST